MEGRFRELEPIILKRWDAEKYQFCLALCVTLLGPTGEVVDTQVILSLPLGELCYHTISKKTVPVSGDKTFTRHYVPTPWGHHDPQPARIRFEPRLLVLPKVWVIPEWQKIECTPFAHGARWYIKTCTTHESFAGKRGVVVENGRLSALAAVISFTDYAVVNIVETGSTADAWTRQILKALPKLDPSRRQFDTSEALEMREALAAIGPAPSGASPRGKSPNSNWLPIHPDWCNLSDERAVLPDALNGTLIQIAKAFQRDKPYANTHAFVSFGLRVYNSSSNLVGSCSLLWTEAEPDKLPPHDDELGDIFMLLEALNSHRFLEIVQHKLLVDKTLGNPGSVVCRQFGNGAAIWDTTGVSSTVRVRVEGEHARVLPSAGLWHKVLSCSPTVVLRRM